MSPLEVPPREQLFHHAERLSGSPPLQPPARHHSHHAGVGGRQGGVLRGVTGPPRRWVPVRGRGAAFVAGLAVLKLQQPHLGLQALPVWRDSGSHLKAKAAHGPFVGIATSTAVVLAPHRCLPADIGGISPGSMPPHSHSLEEEGAAIISHKLVQARLGEACSACSACLAGRAAAGWPSQAVAAYSVRPSLAPCPLLRLLRASSLYELGRLGAAL